MICSEAPVPLTPKPSPPLFYAKRGLILSSCRVPFPHITKKGLQSIRRGHQVQSIVRVRRQAPQSAPKQCSQMVPLSCVETTAVPCIHTSWQVNRGTCALTCEKNNRFSFFASAFAVPSVSMYLSSCVPHK